MRSLHFSSHASHAWTACAHRAGEPTSLQSPCITHATPLSSLPIATTTLHAAQTKRGFHNNLLQRRTMKYTADTEGQLEKMQLSSTADFGHDRDKLHDKDQHQTTSTASSAPFRFLDLPPELRNKIYRLYLVSNEPITLQYDSLGTFDRCDVDMDPSLPAVSNEPVTLNSESTGDIHERYRFTMLPNLSMVSKQLRLETQHVFLDENQFRVAQTLKQKSIKPLLALERLHSAAGTGLRTLHMYHEVWSMCFGGLFKLKADITFSKVQGRIAITKQAYSGTYTGVLDAMSRLPPFDVCGCEMQKLVEEFNTSSEMHDMISFMQYLKWSGGILRSLRSSGLSSRNVGGGPYRSFICWNCPREVWQRDTAVPYKVCFRPFV